MTANNTVYLAEWGQDLMIMSATIYMASRVIVSTSHMCLCHYIRCCSLAKLAHAVAGVGDDWARLDRDLCCQLVGAERAGQRYEGGLEVCHHDHSNDSLIPCLPANV